MSGFASPYSIGRSSHLCAATGRALADGERCVSVLVESPPPPEGDGQLHRLNYSLEAWTGDARPATTGGQRFIGSWKAVVTSADKPRRHALDAESLIDLLTQIEPGDPRRDAVRLVLTMLLLRARALVSDGMAEGCLLVRPRGVPRPPEGPPHIRVADTGLDEATIADVMGELEPLLGLSGDVPESGGAT